MRYLCSCLCLLESVCICSFFFFKQKTAYEMRISDWSSDVCSSDLWMITRQGVCAAVEQPAGLDLRRRGPRRGRDRTGIPPTPSGEDGRTTGDRTSVV